MNKVKINIQLKNGIIPKYMTEGSSGADLCANEETAILPGETKLVSTGIFLEIPEGYECQIRPRSGISLKYSIIIVNSPGTIDSDYRGEIKVIMHNLSKNIFNINVGDRIAQMVFAPVVRAEFIETGINDSKRGKGGFGHTGVE